MCSLAVVAAAAVEAVVVEAEEAVGAEVVVP
jgi:hypothetical protein